MPVGAGAGEPWPPRRRRPRARYWPEFAEAGKEDVLVRHLLSHTAGLPSWDQRLEPDDLYDWDLVTGLLAKQQPWWEPGWKSGYHGLTQGNLVGEVVRRVDGRTVGRFFADEIAGPLGADSHIGLPPEHDHRVALVIPPPPLAATDAAQAAQPELARDSIPYRAGQPAAGGRAVVGACLAAGRDPRRQAATATPAASPSPSQSCRRAAPLAASSCSRRRSSSGSSTSRPRGGTWSESESAPPATGSVRRFGPDPAASG